MGPLKTVRLTLLVALTMGALLLQSDGQQVQPVNEQLRLASVMPRGALLYIQAGNLSALMKRWASSPVKEAFYNSASYAAFAQSHLYLKLESRKADFEKAIGFGLDEGRLTELAGGTSALCMYDIGNLEMVFVTEVPRAQAVASAMFKAAPQFEERQAGGVGYYVHDVTTDGGRINQQFCFSYTGGELIVTTTENLMIRALSNVAKPGSDSMSGVVIGAAQQAKGFAAHDLTLWIDQTSLNKNRHFVNYWIYHNTGEKNPDSLSSIESGLIDLRIAADGMHEQRWFVLKAEDSSAAKIDIVSASNVTGIMRLVPSGTQMVQVSSAGQDAGLGRAISSALFGKTPDDSVTANGTGGGSSQESDNSGGADNQGRTDRYSQLDNRFDTDVDDPGSAVSSKNQTAGTASAQDPSSRFAETVAPLLAKISPTAYGQLIRSKMDAGKPFARFERAVVIEMQSGNEFDKSAFENAVADELRARFVVSGMQPQFGWQDEAGVRYVAQSLSEQGAAYAVTGSYLILASNKEFVKDVLAAASAPPAGALFNAKVSSPVELLSIIRIADAKPVFDALTGKLDGRIGTKGGWNKDSEDENQTIKFFSDNLSSLIAATGIREVQLQREREGSTMTEQVTYIW